MLFADFSSHHRRGSTNAVTCVVSVRIHVSEEDEETEDEAEEGDMEEDDKNSEHSKSDSSAWSLGPIQSASHSSKADLNIGSPVLFTMHFSSVQD